MSNNNLDTSISIIVPFYNGEKYMNKIIKSLENQKIIESNYEIIFVDNNSSDNSLDILSKYPNIKVVKESKPGSYAARNKGISSSKFNNFVFTDVDCILKNDWLYQIEKSINLVNDIDYICIAGNVEYIKSGFSISGLFDTVTFLNQEHNINNNIAVTANLITSRKVIRKVGLFDSNLISGGDVEWTKRLKSNNIELVYNPLIVAYHPIRETFKENIKKCYRVGFGNGQLLRKESRLYAFPKPGVLLPVLKNIRNIDEINVYSKNINFGKKIRLILFAILMQVFNYVGKIAGYISQT